MQRLTLDIAGLAVEIVADDPALAVGPDPSIAPFVADAASPDMAVRARRGPIEDRPPGRLLFDSASLWRLYERDGAYAIRVVAGTRPYVEAIFARDFSTGEVILEPAFHRPGASVYPLAYPLDELAIAARLGSLGGGVVLHAAGVVDARGKGHLFLGPSGAGKTTMARLWRRAAGASILSDDRIVVRRSPEGFTMHGTPWHGTGNLASPGKAPLSRAYFLRQGRRTELVPVGGAAASAFLFACSFPPFFCRTGVAAVLDLLASMVAAVPCAELWFPPEESVVTALGA